MDEVMIGRVMADMEPDLLEFLRTKVTSFVRWDLIRFFHDNPHTTDTAENVARYAGRNEETTKAELEGLAADGVLIENKLGEMTVYSLPNDPTTRDLVRRFVDASEDRQFRVKAIYYIIQGMR
ncbi:MAG: hypothetical protein PVI59_17075 [Anaerolineae bacterium]|jgi:hypothetical protein